MCLGQQDHSLCAGPWRWAACPARPSQTGHELALARVARVADSSQSIRSSAFSGAGSFTAWIWHAWACSKSSARRGRATQAA